MLGGIIKPVVAAVNGDAFGMGCNLALATDFAIASEKARFSMAFVRLGLIPDFGAMYFLPRLIGLWKSKELTYLGSAITAEEAEKIGLIYKVVPHDELPSATRELCLPFTQAPVATQFAKRMVWRGIDMFRNINLEMAEMAMIINSTSPDTTEGPRAWVEKREPKWTAE